MPERKTFQFVVQFSKKKRIKCATGQRIDEFQFSFGWLRGFKRHYDIQLRVISGKSGDVTTEQTDQWTTITLFQLLRDYNPRDIFSADDSRLFYELRL